jgi:GAF domain-containing protein
MPQFQAARRAPCEAQHAANVRALHGYDILDTGPEAPFDAIARVAAHLFRAPTALISLLDVERQWFKSRIGMDCVETPLNQSFCRFAVASDEPMVVLDATEDATFRDNPLVAAEGGIPFYVGAPLRMSRGAVIGTVCVIDYAPRPACAPADVEALGKLACATAEMISLRAMAQTLAEAHDLPVEWDEAHAAA